MGLGYLALDREAATLSGGEMQRLRLAAQLGSGLTGALYVLDEPTIGLHPRDTGRLLENLRALVDMGLDGRSSSSTMPRPSAPRTTCSSSVRAAEPTAGISSAHGPADVVLERRYGDRRSRAPETAHVQRDATPPPPDRSSK